MSQGRLWAGLLQPLPLTHVPCQGAQLRKWPGPRWVVLPPPHPALPLSLWLRAQSPLPSPQVTGGGITKSSAPRPLAFPPHSFRPTPHHQAKLLPVRFIKAGGEQGAEGRAGGPRASGQ